MKKLAQVITHRTRDGGGVEDQLTAFYYDGTGRPQATVFPDQSTEWTFYEFGQVERSVTRKGQTKHTIYDARGREIRQTWDNGAAPEVSRSWDDANRAATLCNIYSTINYEYDGAGLVKTEGNTVAGSAGKAVTTFWRYPSGNVSDVQYPDGISLHREYISRGQLKSVSDGRTAQPTIAYTYLRDGKVNHADYANGVRSAYDYDGRGMTRIVDHYRISGPQDLSWREYTRDERDRITSFKKGTSGYNPMENGHGDRFRYDEEGQLVEGWYNAADPANSGAGNNRYDGFGYDALGNRTQNNYVASRGVTSFIRRDNGLNQYSSWTPSIIYQDDNYPGWGPAGNGVTMADGWVTASYNAVNQPIAIWSPTYNGTSNFMWFGYDPVGRCVKRVLGPSAENGTATYLYYEGWNLIQEGPSSTSASRNYIHGARVDEIVKQITPGNWAERYFHYDARGHCTLQTDAGGGIAEQYEYDAFGQPYFFDANGSAMTVDGRPGSAWGNRFLFTGREYLSDLKLYDYRNRLYQPELGRFLQPDPKEFGAGDYNLYRYCHNDPVNRNDPFGLMPPELEYGADKAGEAAEHLNAMRNVPELAERFKKIDGSPIRNVFKDAQNDSNPARTGKNGLKPNFTDDDNRHPFTRFLNWLLGRPRTVTSYYDPHNSVTATGKTRSPIFGMANELGEMHEVNNHTAGVGGPVAHDNRTIEVENIVRRWFGATERPYKEGNDPYDHQ